MISHLAAGIFARPLEGDKRKRPARRRGSEKSERKKSKESETGRGAESNDCSCSRRKYRRIDRVSRLASYITGCAFLHVRDRSNAVDWSPPRGFLTPRGSPDLRPPLCINPDRSSPRRFDPSSDSARKNPQIYNAHGCLSRNFRHYAMLISVTFNYTAVKHARITKFLSGSPVW